MDIMSEDMNNDNSFGKPTVVPLSESQIKEFKEYMVAKRKTHEKHWYCRSATATEISLGKTRNRTSA